MKTLVINLTLLLLTFTAFAKDGLPASNTLPDTIKILTDTNHNVYYQKTVKVGDNIMAPQIYERAIQVMSAKNLTQNYLDDTNWKLIFTTTQDLNINVNRLFVADINEEIDPYTVQFAITLDIKNGRYRYTVNNIVFFLPINSYNKRETFYETYMKASTAENKRISKNAKALIASFERYLAGLTDDLKQSIEQKATMYNAKF
ncbi:hypothetical protein FO440_12565 [Mucilaginibacter corticis]|uniref:DUF4468 domain-containing protein n=1 Tax=Mucilaginibacter corticis TaxID=2597670 RepID=A0A556ML54_9SPHI|nr:hypothetical protein [Mucilaginibacter corticis]TSJ40578.1 hypothetical protein FO440_12565 [Mucilaginibacter corticis]